MNSILLRALPVFLLIGVGALLRRGGVLDGDFGRSLMRLVFYVALPALLFVTLAETRLQPGFAVLAAVTPVILLGSGAAAYGVARAAGLPGETRGAFLVSGAIMMGAFNFSLLLLLFGREALARGVMIDVVNALLAATVVYLLASAHNPARAGNLWREVRALLKAPLLWSVLLGMGVSLAGGRALVWAPLWDALDLAGRATVPLVYLGVGLFLQLRLKGSGLELLAALCRVGVGLAVGWAAVLILGLEGLDRTAVLVMAASPSGSTAVVYSAQFGLDTPRAANILSLSVVLDLLAVTLLLGLRVI